MGSLKKIAAFSLLLFSLIFIMGGVVVPERAHAAAASLYVGPVSGSYSVGSTFTVSVYLDTGGQSVNAIQANLTFPPDKLQVVSPSSGQSLIQIWVSQPSYSNINGTLSFQGGIPSPGVNTSAGLISTITFRVMDTGTAALSFGDSKVFLNDGAGTNVLGQTTDGIYSLVLPPPAGPTVTSPTNPDQSMWYKTNDAVLAWNAPPGVQGFSYMLSDNPVDEPDDISEGTQTQVAYQNLADGVHYFHIKALRAGIWGGVTDYAVRVDNTPPAAFQIVVLPDAYTSNRNPIIEFQTTDAASGIDHYELKIISLTPGTGAAEQNSQPFFIEASSPYTETLPLGTYDVVVRAFDNAGNVTQETSEISIVSPLFQVIGSEGLRIGGAFVIPWIYVLLVGLILLALLAYILAKVWKMHRRVEERLQRSMVDHPEVAQKLAELKAKQKEYSDLLKKLSVFIIFFGVWWGVAGHMARPARAAGPEVPVQALVLNPPIINLSPASISNNEILYLGGWANVPGATVVIYVEQTETGNTFSGSATVGNDGSWFYSFPQLLDAGHYVAWAQLKSGEVLSPPSARVSIAVEPTAIQIGTVRFDYQDLYFFLFVLFLVAALALLALIIYHARHLRIKKARFEKTLRTAEEYLFRDFSVLRHDIELELEIIHKAKLKGELSQEEASLEAKLKEDLDHVNQYIHEQIANIEGAEKKL